MSTEIVFKCNPESKKSEPKLYSFNSCIAVFHWETDLVCSLKLPKCSILNDNNLYNLRQLSTISHAWNATDREGNIYFLNVCTKLPLNIGCKGNAASCKCSYDSNKELICSEGLGDPSSDELSISSNGSLLLTYKDGKQDHCGTGTRAQTQITFKCGERTGSPKFIEFVKTKCIYKFEWITFMACPVNDRNDVLLDQNNGYLQDKRINALINIESLMGKTFNVNETERQENYIYVINLREPQFKSDPKCMKAAICQTKPNSDFKRDIGSIDSIKYYLKGHELQILLTSTDSKKCGKNKNKNVTSIIRLQCSSAAGLGEPYFVYESNDCDYIFNWETEIVCPKKFVDLSDNGKDDKNLPNDENSKQDKSQSGETGHSRLWIGVVIILLILVTLAVLFLYKQRARYSIIIKHLF
jgi:insulin-like growth factor 2 receptor